MLKGAEFLICGGGIIGLTMANSLLEKGCDGIVIIEKEDDIGKHASGRNSGVLHAGIYYASDSFKAKFCLRGNFLMKEYCRRNGLTILDTGKVIVTKKEEDIKVLQELYERARQNGAKVELIDQKSLAEIEPHAKTCGRALYSYYTAVVDPKKILRSLYNKLLSSGKVSIITNTRFTGLKGSHTALTNSAPIRFKTFINAAGAYSDQVAHMFSVGLHYKLIPFKGTYKKLTKRKSSMVRGNIYPVPNIENPFLGVHFTRGIDGEVSIGPTAIPALGRENYGICSGLDLEALEILYRDAILLFSNPKFRKVAFEEPKKYRFKHFFQDIRTMVDEITPDDIEASSKVGIRPQLVDWRKKELIMDFLVIQDGDSLHIMNAISPAFTCSMAFAEFIVDKYLS